MSRALLLTLLTLASTAAVGAEEPAAMLMRMSEAARDANYQGVIVYRTQDRLETLRVVHGVREGAEIERIQTLTGAPSEIVKLNGRVICLLPKDRRLTLDRPTPKGLFPVLSEERVAQLMTMYEFEAIGAARVAGRQCHGLAITPKDELRYGYRIWADAETGVPLKVNLVGREGRVLEQMMFTEVEFPEQLPDAVFDTEADQARVQSAPPPRAVAVDARALPEASWQFRELPPGFRVAMRERRLTADGGGVVDHVLLTDGLTAISVFSAYREASAPAFQGQSRMGAVHAFGRMLGTFHITVVGEAPPETVRMIGESLQPPPAASEPATGPGPGPGEPR
ncbi:MAG: MucB/RseB C-terminal domain-containing protein [Pseudomonadota bacterium]